ncbi:MAG: rhamnosyltransferase [Candidatus Zixiibacteriota bacterium]|nr:MAG: rhamnosyltransferase [candidate division Zixibacteria bacterium]
MEIDSRSKPTAEAAKSTSFKTALVLPTLNAAPDLVSWLAALRTQTLVPDRLLLVDSSSNDDTVQIAQQAGFETTVIPREEFSHGGTRQMCVNQLEGSDIVVFLTQDAMLASPNAIEKLLSRFNDPKVAAAYGRQLPRREADPIEAHARLFNYSDETRVKSLDDIPRLGIKTAFISNSFAAYRRKALMEAGGFPSHTIQNEDTYVASKLILAGWKVAYVAEAAVYHSHPFTIGDEFRRYFDIGVFHARDRWIRESFGQAEGEGMRFVKSELRYLKKSKPSVIPSAILRTAMKLLGYKLGNREQVLPLWLKRAMSKNRRYWDTERKEVQAR